MAVPMVKEKPSTRTKAVSAGLLRHLPPATREIGEIGGVGGGSGWYAEEMRGGGGWYAEEMGGGGGWYAEATVGVDGAGGW
jgi:hypothetical protein